MKKLPGVLLALAICASAAPVRVIFDTDMGNDVDDALALAMIHALETKAEAKLLAVTITKDNRWAAPYISLMNTFYGRGEIPIGMVRNGPTPADSKMIQMPSERTKPDGSFVYPRRLKSGADAPEATGLLRSILAAEKDHAVTIVQVGFSTNLARLIESPADRELVRRKVRLLAVMAGAFPEGKPEYNVKTDIPSAKRVFESWPTPIVASGFEVGLSILYPATSIEHDFGYVADHPIADAYRAYKQMPYDRPTWDPTAALYAIRPDSGYFSLSANGEISVDGEGRTHFREAPDGRHRYLLVNDEQRARVLKIMIELASFPPPRVRAGAAAKGAANR
jgi:inosine-uridine nucleoside N-ribohydrolase